MKPLRDLIIIELEEPEKQSKSGIFLTKAWENTQNVGVVEAVGPDVTICKKGDKIMINPYATLAIPGTETKKFVKECDVLCYV